jgi:tetratricopeptide (TPR) repeat protein
MALNTMQLQNSITIFKQAQYWQRKGKLAEAERAYHRAGELNPLFYGNFQCLGKVLLLQGKLDEAVCAYRKANQLNPKVLSVHYELGEILRQQGKLDEAIAYFKSVIEANPNFSWAYHGLGKCYLSLNEWKKAISCHAFKLH